MQTKQLQYDMAVAKESNNAEYYEYEPITIQITGSDNAIEDFKFNMQTKKPVHSFDRNDLTDVKGYWMKAYKIREDDKKC